MPDQRDARQRWRLMRDESPLPPTARIVRALSGAETLTRNELGAAAQSNFDRYGFWGVSVFAARGADGQRLLTRRFARFPRLALFTAGNLVDGGVSLLPTGATPHYDLAILVHGKPSAAEGEADALVDRIMAVPHTLVENEHYDPEGGQE